MLIIVPASCFMGLGQKDTVKPVSLADVFRLVLNTLDIEVAMGGEKARQFCNPTANKEREVENWCLPQSALARYSSTNELQLHHLVNDTGQLTQGNILQNWRSALNFCWLCVTWTSAGHIWFCQQKARLPFALSGMHIEAQAGHIRLGHDNGKSPGFFAFFTGAESPFLYAHPRVTPIFALPRQQNG